MAQKFGVIGFPIGHTMSPFIHTQLFASRGFSAEYGKKEIAPEKLGEEFENTLKNYDGFNVTIPHKVAIINYLNELDESAKEYGAVNVVVNKNGKYIGYNTDAYGFLKGLELSGISLSGRVMVYGFGGAARTIITEAVKAGCEVTIGTIPKLLTGAEEIAKELGNKLSTEIKVITNEQITENYNLLVNATPVGMFPKVDAMPIEPEKLALFDAVYDIVYNPEQTLLLKTAKQMGKQCGGGLSMLVAQAAKAHTIFYGAEFSGEEIINVIEKTAKEQEAIFKNE
ncbi:MAG: shikimate dehydrogenase [Clostridia bacterium]|nr:shikimate dehydrogenase [Clostridia bacterium]